MRSSCAGSGAAFSPAAGSVKWQRLEDGVPFGHAPGSSSRRRRRRRRPAARSRRVCAQHPVGRPRRWRRRGALGSRALPLRAAGRPGQQGSRPQALVGARAELGREASGSGHRPRAHPLYTIRTAAVPDPSRNESPKFQRQHKRASHFTSWPLIRATRAANTLCSVQVRRGVGPSWGCGENRSPRAQTQQPHRSLPS